MRFIGDVHGKIEQYTKIALDAPESIQVGDMGAGFAELAIMPESHKFIRGNHDNPAICKTNPNWIPDCTIINNMFFVGGAYSIDKNERTIGVDWWGDEELDHQSAWEAIDKFGIVKPKIMITHDCPQGLAQYLFPEIVGRDCISSRTGLMLQYMFEQHKPEYWLFGHWHQNVDKVICGTRFICLAELSFIDLEV